MLRFFVDGKVFPLEITISCGYIRVTRLIARDHYALCVSEVTNAGVLETIEL